MQRASKWKWCARNVTAPHPTPPMLTKTWMQWASKWKWCSRNVIVPHPTPPHPTPTLPASMCAGDRSMCADDPLSMCAGDPLSMCAGDPLSMCAGDPLSMCAGDPFTICFLGRPPVTTWPLAQRLQWLSQPWLSEALVRGLDGFEAAAA